MIDVVQEPRAALTALEFFAGVGLARMGLEQAGWQVLFANDNDAAKRRMHDGHFGPSPHYVVEDIHNLQAADLPTAVLAHASFPCTDLSLAGGRRGLNSGQSSAFWGWVQLLRDLGESRPPLVLIENVTGLLSSHNGADFRALIEALNGLGYSADAMVVDAAHFTPQSRPRLFVVGVSLQEAPPTGWECERIKIGRLQASTIRPTKLVEAIQSSSDLDWEIADLPDSPPILPEYRSVRLVSALDKVPLNDPQWWSRERAEYLLDRMSDRHRAIAEEMIAGRRLCHGTVFRRMRKGRSMAELRTDGLAGCLRTPKGGSGRQILFEAGFGEYRVRLMNPNECACLMGAKGYRIDVPLNQALFGFGDAVCVDALAWVVEHRINPVAERITAARASAARS